MSHVFYRKYRPKTFREVSGQEFIVKVLQEAVHREMISHAYLLAGPRGTGKTTFARILAKALNCLAPKHGDPCGICENCVSIEKGFFVDVIEMDAASHGGVDEVREIKDAVEFQPMHSQYKVYIIDEAHMLSKAACNALLKILEEPPRYVVFILATTEPEKMIPTVLSRVQRFDFKKLTFKEVRQKLTRIIREEQLAIPDDALTHICYLAEGCLRDAEMMLDQVAHIDLKEHNIQKIFNRPSTVKLMQLLHAVATRNSSDSLAELTEFEASSIPPVHFLRDLLSLARKVVLLKLHKGAVDILSKEIGKEDIATLTLLAEQFELHHLTTLIQNLIESRKNIYYSPLPFLPIELAILTSFEETARS